MKVLENFRFMLLGQIAVVINGVLIYHFKNS